MINEIWKAVFGTNPSPHEVVKLRGQLAPIISSFKPRRPAHESLDKVKSKLAYNGLAEYDSRFRYVSANSSIYSANFVVYYERNGKINLAHAYGFCDDLNHVIVHNKGLLKPRECAIVFLFLATQYNGLHYSFVDKDVEYEWLEISKRIWNGA